MDVTLKIFFKNTCDVRVYLYQSGFSGYDQVGFKSLFVSCQAGFGIFIFENVCSF